MVIGWSKWTGLEFRCRNVVDLDPMEPQFDIQWSLRLIDAIRANES